MANAFNGVSRFSLIFPPFRILRKIDAGGGRIRGPQKGGGTEEVGRSIGEGYAGW